MAITTYQMNGSVMSECTALLGQRLGSEGFQTVASARALRQPTSCGSEYFYNQCPRVQNLIGTERSLIEVSIGLIRKQAKSNSVDIFRNTEVFSNRPGFQIMKADYFRYMEIESQRYSQGAGIG